MLNSVYTVEKELNDIQLESFKEFCKEVIGNLKRRLEIHILCKKHKQQDKAKEKEMKNG